MANKWEKLDLKPGFLAVLNQYVPLPLRAVNKE